MRILWGLWLGKFPLLSSSCSSVSDQVGCLRVGRAAVGEVASCIGHVLSAGGSMHNKASSCPRGICTLPGKTRCTSGVPERNVTDATPYI